MRKIYGNVVLITGASSGIGKATAECLASQGYRVYGTSRSIAANSYIDCSFPSSNKNTQGFFKLIKLDVCDEDSIKTAIKYILEREGNIDILINNAGIGIAGSIEDTTAEEAKLQFDTNFFGVIRTCRNVLPHMRAKGNGLIINISSVAGIISIPFQSMYSSSKYAVEALTEALRMEVMPFGIKVSMVEPGDTKTNFTDTRTYSKAANETSAYWDKFNKSVNTMIKSEKNGPGPEKVVRAIMKIINQKKPPVRIVPGVSYKTIALLKKILPSRLVVYIVSKIY